MPGKFKLNILTSTETSKQCCDCLILKDFTEFNKYKAHKTGRQRRCKICQRIEGKKYKELNYNSILQKSRIHHEKNKDSINKKAKDRYHKNLEFSRAKQKKYYENNKSACMKRTHDWVKRRAKKEYIGCSLDEVKSYIEKQFQSGMSWENHGRDGWHIDHIIPLASAKTSEELYKLLHYTNLQPLWAKDNLSKGSKHVS